MDIPRNTFRDALREGRPQIGLWVGLADANAAEALAAAGYDWLVLDGEHAPNDPRSVLTQLRAVAAYPVHAVVRPVQGDVALIKQYLDIGAQTLLVPMVDTAKQAELMVRAMRYAPEGVRGMGAALARASRWGQVPDYVHLANEQMCLLVQAETRSRSTTWPRSPRSTASTACSSARPTSRPRWGCAASPVTPTCSERFATASPPFAPPARRPASWSPT